MEQTILGQQGKRYYVVSGERLASGEREFALVEGVPDPASPHRADKDGRSDQALLKGIGAAFWSAVNLAGFVWVQRDFKRFWEFDPRRAARVRNGEM